ncbi:tetratricopeptide repeat protein [Methylorubrum extorquens]
MGGRAGQAKRRPGRALLRAGFAVGLCAAASAAEAARLVSAKGAQPPEGFGRIVLTFDEPVSVKARLSGAILVLNFGEAVGSGPERIAAGMPDYVTVVRRDPDGSALRLALQRPYRVNVQDAGEQVFIDLLPESWNGFLPPLPTEVVADLARRAAAAEASLKARNPAPVPRPLTLELARTDARTRLSLRLPAGSEAAFAPDGSGTRLTLPGAWRIDDHALRGRLDPNLGRVTVETETGEARIVASPAEGVTLSTLRDEDVVAIDFVTKPKTPETATSPAPSAGAPAAAAKEAPKESSRPAASSADASRRAAAPAVLSRKAGSGLVFPFAKRVSAALFERGGIVTLVFATTEPVVVPPPGATGLVALAPPQRGGGFTILRFTAPAGRLVDLLPVTEPAGWELATGEGLAPSESLTAQRAPTAQGRLGVSVRLPQAGLAGWLDLDGERIAVVTTDGNRPAGVVKAQRFVEFELIPSRLGLAVLANADDLIVRPDLDGVTIGREGAREGAREGRDGGLSVSGISRPADPPVGAVTELAVDRDAWERAQRGDVRATLREGLAAAVAAHRRDRGGARLGLARAMMANDLDVEALGALTAAAAEDVVIDGDRQTALMRGILLARIGRAEEARKLLSDERLATNPEARLWRGYADALVGRWNEAAVALRAGESVLERYPEPVASLFHAAAAEAAVETGDWEAVTRESIAATRAATDYTRDRLTLLRAKMDQATGRSAAALAAYETLRNQAPWPLAAEATLRAAVLGHTLGKTPLPEAIDQLEVLALTWHGGPTEIGTLGALGGLYEEAGRWRKIFTTARRANALSPEAPISRALHERALAVFEDLFLGARGERLGGVEALALYFDFKDFAPAGRRADEIVRRLADRLVALDLLESADELLQYQIDHRLEGTARSSVSARLATIRLMEGKPLQALQTLDATHLPELPEDVRRARAMLRARALSDLSRTDLALETVEGETGADAERLRADILWAARRWREAGEAHEMILGPAWRSGKPLDDTARADVIRAGIAYGLAGESLGLERLKAKFAGPMAESADARTFAMLTRPDAPRSAAFRDAALRATKAETLAAFLSEYRKRYPDSAVPEPGSAATGNRAEAPSPPPG